jgi:glycosyltransferase involved in cell wall biosynthesis
MKKVGAVPFKKARVALVYDRVNTPVGGAERVLLDLQRVFPAAPLFTSVYVANQAKWAKTFEVIPSFLQHWPFAQYHHRWWVGAMPMAFESLDLSEFDVVISLTSAEAKSVLTKPEQLHVCYLLTPTRYLWSHESEYAAPWFVRWLQKPLWRYLQWWDQAAAYRPDAYIALSQRVARLCQRYYHRQPLTTLYPALPELPSTAIRPTQLSKSVEPHSFVLSVARLVRHKNIDVAVRAAIDTRTPLVLVGQGPEADALLNLAQGAAFIHFLPRVTEAELAWLYQHCAATILVGIEDLGLAPLESIAHGKPAIVHFESGSAELIQDGVTGLFLSDTRVETVVNAFTRVFAQVWPAPHLRDSVKQLTFQSFAKNFYDKVEQLWYERNS